MTQVPVQNGHTQGHAELRALLSDNLEQLHAMIQVQLGLLAHWAWAWQGSAWQSRAWQSSGRALRGAGAAFAILALALAFALTLALSLA